MTHAASDEEDVREVARALQTLRAPLVRLILARTEQRKHGATPAERLSPPQHLALLALADGPLGIGELAGATGVAVSTATRMAQGLERAGMVARRPIGDDRRRREVDLTPHGRAVLTEASAVQARRIEELLTPLSPARRRAILAGVEALTDALAAGSPGDPPAARSRARPSARARSS
jgi:DNA-binding MarR family transcriptional regulator